MKNKISVITVVYNDVKNIRSTIESFFSQTWKDKEYIIIDGGSTDGTKNIIEEYSDKISYWCSEKDDGMYDAMNKGILRSTGDWINILNSGDYFVSNRSLEKMMTTEDLTDVDVVYGNSIEINNGFKRRIVSSENPQLLNFRPIYRHGSSLVRASVHRSFLYDISKSNKLAYSLDWEMIFRLYKNNLIFRKVNVDVEAYKKEGISNNPIRNLWYNYLITSQSHFNIKKAVFFVIIVLKTIFKRTKLYLYLRAFIVEYITNDILPHIPFWNFRKFYLKILGTKIGSGSFIMKKNYLINPNQLSIGSNSHINRGCILDARGFITIGDSVSISHNVSMMTGSHEIDSRDFCGVFKPIVVKDYAWLGVNCCILQGVTIGKGAVVCAGAVVTKDIDDFSVVGGIPAVVIKKRNNNLNYQCKWILPLT